MLLFSYYFQAVFCFFWHAVAVADFGDGFVVSPGGEVGVLEKGESLVWEFDETVAEKPGDAHFNMVGIIIGEGSNAIKNEM